MQTVLLFIAYYYYSCHFPIVANEQEVSPTGLLPLSRIRWIYATNKFEMNSFIFILSTLDCNYFPHQEHSLVPLFFCQIFNNILLQIQVCIVEIHLVAGCSVHVLETFSKSLWGKLMDKILLEPATLRKGS